MSQSSIGGWGPARYFAILKNGTATASVVGDCVVYDFETANDGFTVIQPVTNLLALPAGAWYDVGIPYTGRGRTVIYGYIDVEVLGHASMALGTAVECTDQADYASYTGTYSPNVFGVTCEVYTNTTVAAKKKVFIRAM